MFRGSPESSVIFWLMPSSSGRSWKMSCKVEVVRTVSCNSAVFRRVSKSYDKLVISRSCEIVSYCGGAVTSSRLIFNNTNRLLQKRQRSRRFLGEGKGSLQNFCLLLYSRRRILNVRPFLRRLLGQRRRGFGTVELFRLLEVLLHGF